MIIPLLSHYYPMIIPWKPPFILPFTSGYGSQFVLQIAPAAPFARLQQIVERNQHQCQRQPELTKPPRDGDGF